MAEQIDLRKYLDEKFAEINKRFDKNEEEHRTINNHLEELNNKTAKNTAFRNKYSGVLDRLISDREYKIRLAFDFFWKALLIGTLLLLGLENVIGYL